MSSRACGRCGQQRPITANWRDGPVCATCYCQAKWRRGVCAQCATERPLPGQRSDGAWLCVDCGRVPLDLVCRRCSREAYLHKDHLCQCCELDDLLVKLFGKAGAFPPAIAPIAQAMRTTSLKEAASALVTLRRPVIKDVLSGIALPATRPSTPIRIGSVRARRRSLSGGRARRRSPGRLPRRGAGPAGGATPGARRREGAAPWRG